MKLTRLMVQVPCRIVGSHDPEVSGISYNSRTVRQGDLFVALPGHHAHGRSFIPAAVERGAVAVLTDQAGDDAGTGVPVVVVDDPARAMAAVSATFYHHPDRDLLMVGVTGTNGKTTITYLLESIFSAAGRPAGVMGTVNYRYGRVSIPAPNTTPQSADVFRLLRDMAGQGMCAAVMEVSSHALSLGRVAGVEFDIAVFTNLTRDHLDFHGTMEEYFEAKASLFSGLRPGHKQHGKCAIINMDDPWADRLSARVTGAEVVTYGVRKKAQVRAEHINMSARGTAFTLVAPGFRGRVCTPLLGEHNVHNVLAAIATARAAGIPCDTVLAGIRAAPPVPGRLEPVDEGQPFTVVIDYAHTDDALLNVLRALRSLDPLRIITVFGCGGERDRTKRPIMGDTATALSDYVFVTSDNPRDEDPEKIALDIEVGIRRQNRENYQVLLDREQAIAAAVAMGRKGDVILIAGKGHETYQIVGDQKLSFNDRDVARTHLRRLYGKH